MLITRTYYNWIYIPDSFWTLGGKTNDADIIVTSYGKTFPQGSLLFIPKNATRAFSSDGTEGWTVSVQFQFQKQGWNKWYFVDVGEDGTVIPGEGSYEPLYYKRIMPSTGSAIKTRWVPNPQDDFTGWLF